MNETKTVTVRAEDEAYTIGFEANFGWRRVARFACDNGVSITFSRETNSKNYNRISELESIYTDIMSREPEDNAEEDRRSWLKEQRIAVNALIEARKLSFDM